MEKEKQKRLEAKGYKIGSAGDFLGLTREEEEYTELKLAIGETLAQQRKQNDSNPACKTA